MQGEQAAVAQIADAWQEPEAEQMTKGEHLLRRTGGIGVMLFYLEIAFMINKTVEHMGRFALGGADYLDVVPAELVGGMTVEFRTRIAAIAGVDSALRLSPASGPIILAAGGGCCSVAPVL